VWTCCHSHVSSPGMQERRLRAGSGPKLGIVLRMQAAPYTAGDRTVAFDTPCGYFEAGKTKASTLSLSVLVAIEMLNAMNALSEVLRSSWAWRRCRRCCLLPVHCKQGVLCLPFFAQGLGILERRQQVQMLPRPSCCASCPGSCCHFDQAWPVVACCLQVAANLQLRWLCLVLCRTTPWCRCRCGATPGCWWPCVSPLACTSSSSTSPSWQVSRADL
jgi:hypothetical protein